MKYPDILASMDEMITTLSDIDEVVDNAGYFKEVLCQLELAKQKYPDDGWPWNDPSHNIFQQVGHVINEAGEAFKSASKHFFNGTLCMSDREPVKNVIEELFQTMSTALRVIQQIEKDYCFDACTMMRDHRS